MKKLLLLNVLLAVLVTPVHAATIKVFATDVVATTYGGFTQTAGDSTLLTDAEIASIISIGPATAIYGSGANGNSHGTGTITYSSIDLGFGANTALTGAGTDLVVLSLWSGTSNNYNFGLQAFAAGNSTTPISSFNYQVTGNALLTGDCAITDSTGGCSAYISALSIDLLDSSGLALGDNIELGFIRMFIGGDIYNGTGTNAYSNFTQIGANYANIAAVPLPLPVILFSSGLALLGWVGRRRKV